MTDEELRLEILKQIVFLHKGEGIDKQRFLDDLKGSYEFMKNTLKEPVEKNSKPNEYPYK